MSQAKNLGVRVYRRIGGAGLILALGFFTWYLWVLIAGVRVEYGLELTSSYVIAPAALVLGVVAGGLLRPSWWQGRILPLLILLMIVAAFAIPIYANASAAVGGLFIGLIGLGALDIQGAVRSSNSWRRQPRDPVIEHRALRQALVLGLMLCIGVFLVLGAQAAIVLTVPVIIVVVWAVWRSSGPPQWLVVLFGTLVAVAAVLIVVFLGSRASWPAWLASGDSLSSARHTLWSDALSLWATAPIFGTGPGSFTPSSELASNIPSLAAVHSLPLQVGSELGIVGLVLLASLFIGGLVFAARGARPVAFIAIAAWTALAVHSSMDHLEDFPIVGFMGGLILGWAGIGQRFLAGSRGGV